ncbi:mesoderm induction early response protein 1 [Striga asiatica]|uniref:Mesoderm induction early response protein 1 n=1 Tax=Striga asiatica TaxID=4170 RepID=A0A5A7PU09_STRAF|nr:mesoderm induction early response protein 1 [Striga asiatica]
MDKVQKAYRSSAPQTPATTANTSLLASSVEKTSSASPSSPRIALSFSIVPDEPRWVMSRPPGHFVPLWTFSKLDIACFAAGIALTECLLRWAPKVVKGSKDD